MRVRRIVSAAAGMGLLFAWMGSVFLRYGLMERLSEAGYSGWNPVHLFLGVHGLTYLVQAIIPGGPGDERHTGLLGAISMLLLPLLLHLSTRLGVPFSSIAAVSGLVLSAAGAAMLIGMLGMSLTSLIPDDVAVVFGLAPLVAAIAGLLASLVAPLLLSILAPVLSAGLILSTAGGPEAKEAPARTARLPFWRLSVFLFCLYAANGFLLGLKPALFHAQRSAAPFIDGLTGVVASLAAAAAFRFYPRAELRTFYKGAFPFIATALFLMAFSPLYALPSLLLETGLAFLDLYAWLLLIYFASRSGEGRKRVVHGGLFLIVLAGGTVHLPAFSGETGYISLLVPGVCLLLLMLVLWDGAEVPLQPERSGEDPSPVADGAGEPVKSATPEEKKAEEELLLRARLMEFNLTRQETEIALLLLKGQKDRNICSMLFITQNTLKYHLRNIYRKTGTANRLELRENLG
ncbi:MAG: helix-turn-helix transcriptional regulator [Synergistaceae bacterium]|nr:helix-turn-helix transcriptional regulator [Synergistota bacterium]NLM71715.1 helix-turn-helix transcriptional regulator [Synergistaceae bacterium]